MHSAVKLQTMANVLVVVDGFSDGDLTGRLYGYHRGRTYAYTSAMELLFLLDSYFDCLGAPQRFTQVRSFGAGVRADLFADRPFVPGRPEGALASFEVQVLSRQWGEWQGHVQWLEGGKSCAFQSALSLLRFILATFKEPRSIGAAI